MYEKAAIDVAKIPEFVESFGGSVRFVADAKAPYFVYMYKRNSRERSKNPMELLEHFLDGAKVLLFEE
jgi:transcription-repair coupling factor (superfamily II helicase)